jgi:uncharacterized protein YydD (DUF2326 family)
MTEKIINKSFNITLDLPIKWKAKIDNLAQEKNESLSNLITDIIGQYLGDNLDDINVNRLQENYQDLSKRLKVLEAKDYQIERLQNRLDIMEKLIASLQNQVISRSLDSLSYSVSIEEEIEDEPDEILTAFLD